VLGWDDEYDLAVCYKKIGDFALAYRLVEGHLRLVVKIAHDYAWSRQSEADLVQAGNLGLLRAIEKYDPDRGVRLPSYAAWWIRACMLKLIVDNWRLVRVGTTARQRRLMANLRLERDRLEREGVDVDQDALAFIRHATSPEVPLDALAPGRTTTRLEELPAAEEARPDLQVEAKEYLEAVRRVINGFASRLQGREAVVFRERWGRTEQATLQKLGDRYGLSRERIRQIETRILDQLRRQMVGARLAA
jgi:RNA polymerase sigma-32 factor